MSFLETKPFASSCKLSFSGQRDELSCFSTLKPDLTLVLMHSTVLMLVQDHFIFSTQSTNNVSSLAIATNLHQNRGSDNLLLYSSRSKHMDVITKSSM